jgi:hypothetical protein
LYKTVYANEILLFSGFQMINHSKQEKLSGFANGPLS